MDGRAKTSSVEILLTGMEGVGLPFLKKLEELWGAKAAGRFGCAQMRADFMFTDENGVGDPVKPGVLYNMDPYVLLEVLDPSTGQPVRDGEFGELVVTSLYHLDNPVIRNRLRDGAVYRAGGYVKGARAFHGVEVGTIGRLDDVKKVKGVNLYPQAVDDLVFSVPEISHYDVVITSATNLADEIALRLQLKPGTAEVQQAELRDRLMKALSNRMGINFDVEFVSKIAVNEYKAHRWKDLRIR
jgi:phenylacetate-CoA ligase